MPDSCDAANEACDKVTVMRITDLTCATRISVGKVGGWSDVDVTGAVRRRHGAYGVSTIQSVAVARRPSRAPPPGVSRTRFTDLFPDAVPSSRTSIVKV